MKKCLFSLAAFKIFYLSLVFRSLIIIGLDVEFFWLISSGVCSASWICMFMPFTKFRKFSTIISLSIFRLAFFFFSFQDSSETNGRSLTIESHKSLRIFISQSISLCYLDWAISIVPSWSEFTDASHYLLHSAVEPICWDFYFVTAFFSSKFSFHFSLYLLFLPWDCLFQVGLESLIKVLLWWLFKIFVR